MPVQEHNLNGDLEHEGDVGGEPPHKFACSLQNRTRILWRTTAPVGPPLKPQQRLQYRPLLVRDLSASSHRHFGRLSELPFCPAIPLKAQEKSPLRHL